MLKYFYIKTDNLSDEEIIKRLNIFFDGHVHGALYFDKRQPIKLFVDDNEYRMYDIWSVKSQGIFGNYSLDTFDMFFIPYNKLKREELIQICEVCKKYINNEIRN